MNALSTKIGLSQSLSLGYTTSCVSCPMVYSLSLRLHYLAISMALLGLVTLFIYAASVMSPMFFINGVLSSLLDGIFYLLFYELSTKLLSLFIHFFYSLFYDLPLRFQNNFVLLFSSTPSSLLKVVFYFHNCLALSISRSYFLIVVLFSSLFFNFTVQCTENCVGYPQYD